MLRCVTGRCADGQRASVPRRRTAKCTQRQVESNRTDSACSPKGESFHHQSYQHQHTLYTASNNLPYSCGQQHICSVPAFVRSMLDNFTILHSSGIVLWSKSFIPTFQANSPIGPLIRTAFIESRSQQDEERFDFAGYTCRWSLANDYGLAFVAVHQRILHLAYIPNLLAQVRALFLELFKPFLSVILANTRASTSASSAGVASRLTREARAQFAAALKDWDAVFLSTLRKLEREAAQQARTAAKVAPAHGTIEITPAASPKTMTDKKVKGATPGAANDEQAIARNIETLKARLKGVELGPGSARGPPGAKKKAAGNRMATGAGTPGCTGVPATPSGTGLPGGAARKKGAGKEMRKWDASGNAIVVGDTGQLDFSNARPSTPADEKNEQGTLEGWIDVKSIGRMGSSGLYEVADALDFEGFDEEDDDDDQGKVEKEAHNGKSGKEASGAAAGGFLAGLTAKAGAGGASSLFSRLTGSGRSLTQAELQPTLNAMQSHLQSKNVAADVAQRLCAAVGRSLEGKTLSTFGNVRKEVRSALEDAITRVLTPHNSTDLMLEINDKLNRQKASGTGAKALKQPYALAFVGVNGVGKSTNLAKVCFWLLQNQKRVLIAACDTFRSGAVEQLRVHVRNLGELSVGGAKVKEPLKGEGLKLELYERGYGKDAAGIAASALFYARQNGFDVVLIDTAGRMQDNEPLMRALAKLVATNDPDRVIFVGEALVGNEAVDQLTRFDKTLKDFSGKSGSAARGLDGMLLTKFDTIDDKVGTALTATSVTGLPIYFVGVGQTYTDLKQLRVRHIVNALMRD